MTREDIIRMAREAGAVPHAKDAFGDPTGFSVGVANFERFAALVAKHERERIAAELRRLYAENADFRATCDHLTRENAEQIGEIVALKEQRYELLEALHLALEYWAHREQRYKNRSPVWVQKSRAAIAKAGGAA